MLSTWLHDNVRLVSNLFLTIGAILFLIGSILFLSAPDPLTAVWLFIIGSVLFIIGPGLIVLDVIYNHDTVDR